MKANELMVGDLVYSSFSDIPCKVQYLELRESGYGSVKTSNVDGIKDIASLSPIPLTPEILEKNGFVKEEEERGFSEPYCVYVCDDFQYVIKIYPKNLMDRYSRLYIGEYDDNENASLLINHLHELQHALKLFGIDKTIEL